MTWGFFGTDKEITLDKFKELVIKGEVRYVMVGGQGGGSNNDIMNWVKNNGKVVAESEWKTPTGAQNNITSNTGAKTNIDAKTSATKNQQLDGGNSEQLYDLKGYANTGAKK